MNKAVKKLLQLLLILCAMLAPGLTSTAFAKDVSLSMAYTNALGNELPFSIFSKQSWSPDPNARYVKLHLYFDEPIMVRGLEIDSCGTQIDQNLSIFINFDQWVLHIDPSASAGMPGPLHAERKGDRFVIENLFEAITASEEHGEPNLDENGEPVEDNTATVEKNIEVRSMTINFERSKGFRICGIHLKDPEGQDYTIKTPAMVPGKVQASSTLDPQTAYDPIYLFDSRFEYGWASNKLAKNVSLSFNFDEPKRIEKIRIWNGYQRSVNHCQSNSRAKTIRVTGDGGYSEVITISDILGAQVVDLPKPFTGKQLKFDIIDSFLGKSYQDLVISELRFFDGKQWFMLDPTRKLQENIAANRALFTQARAGEMISESFVGERQYDVKFSGENKKPTEVKDTANANSEDEILGASDNAVLRLRADGSFYISGTSWVEASGKAYFALGNYEVKSADAKNGTRLRLFGLYYETPAYRGGDCNGCGRDCNKNVSTNDGSTQNIFQEFVTIKVTPDGLGKKFEITNESGGKKLPFKMYRLIKEKGNP